MPPTTPTSFIDGDHLYEGAKFDLMLARRVVKPGGWIVVHDYAYPSYFGDGWEGVVRAVDDVLGDLPETATASANTPHQGLISTLPSRAMAAKTTTRNARTLDKLMMPT